jgi:hypothetical protein
MRSLETLLTHHAQPNRPLAAPAVQDLANPALHDLDEYVCVSQESMCANRGQTTLTGQRLAAVQSAQPLPRRTACCSSEKRWNMPVVSAGAPGGC